MRFTKNASLNLSINAIVILILAITMLGLGLGFMRNIFGSATEEFTKVGGTVQKQMVDQMKETSKIVTFYSIQIFALTIEKSSPQQIRFLFTRQIEYMINVVSEFISIAYLQNLHNILLCLPSI